MGVAVEYFLEAGPPQQHQMSKSWRAFTYTKCNTYIQRHIFRLLHKDVTLMNITMEGSHMAIVRRQVISPNQELGGTLFTAGMVGAR